MWKAADAWWVGYYLLMPDHIHLVCSPHKPEVTLIGKDKQPQLEPRILIEDAGKSYGDNKKFSTACKDRYPNIEDSGDIAGTLRVWERRLQPEYRQHAARPG
ncbi:MAG: hypothetical protein A2X46_00005 [Lentisphaerae bacterium GWF2_57_35]|nr:MAG: hypothetical protein A2X46_00005 [Lentisphaerae bacterium GWF2_57_35]